MMSVVMVRHGLYMTAWCRHGGGSQSEGPPRWALTATTLYMTAGAVMAMGSQSEGPPRWP